METFLNTPGATCLIEQNGSDGVLYGTSHLLSPGDGTGTFTFDYSELGAPEPVGIESMSITASGVPELTISAADD